MNTLTTTGSPSGSPATGGVTVAISSSFEINGQQVTISSQDIKNISTGINFSLAQPVALGSINDFLDWLHKTFGVPLTSDDLTTAINHLPDSPDIIKQIKDALLGFLDATITITMLSVNTQTGVYKFGVSMTMSPPIEILGVLGLNSIGVEVTSGVPVTSP
jgi:hypothetical protein